MSFAVNIIKNNITSALITKCTSKKEILINGQKRGLSVEVGKLINDDVTNTFFLPVDSEMATVSYDKQNGVLNLNHTMVPDKYRGQGVGHIIAKEVFEYCADRKLKMILRCSFLQKYYEENPLPKYKDLIVVR